MKMNIEFEETDPAQVANGLVRLLSLALQTGVRVESEDGSYSVTNPGDEECVRRWIGPDGEYRRDVMERRWVVKETTDASGQRIPPQAA
jgi:hypothetical protein